MGQKRTFLDEKAPEQEHGKLKQSGDILKTSFYYAWIKECVRYGPRKAPAKY